MLTRKIINCLQKIYFLTQIVIITLFFESVTTSALRANLNGFTTPIFVSNTYTFTDGERADGFVTFLNGFDLPINGTVTLNLSPGCLISGDIQMNGGTLIVTSPVILGPGPTTFYGNGYFNIPLLVGTEKIRIEGNIRCSNQNMTIKGMGPTNLDLSNGSLDCQGIADTIAFDNIQISGFTNIITNPLSPRHFNLSNSEFNVEDNIITVFSPFIKTSGICSIGTGRNGFLTCPGVISIDTGSELTISTPSRIQIGGLLTQEAESLLILDSASLDFNNTNSIGIPLTFANLSSSSAGKLFISGKSNLSASGLHPITIPSSVSLIIGAGSRLGLEAGLQLSII